MLRAIVVLATIVCFDGCAHRQNKAPTNEDSGVLLIEEVPRPFLADSAWNLLAPGMTGGQVEKLLGRPDDTTGPLTITSPGIVIVKREGKEERFTTRPTTFVTTSWDWQYTRPTSESPEIIYTIEFDHDRVTAFHQRRIGPTTKP